MSKSSVSFLIGSLFAAVLFFTPSLAQAANGDCGQPVSVDAEPTTTDALFILRAAVGSEECGLCPCDVDQADGIKTTDALITLNVAVGKPGIVLNCAQPCPAVNGPENPCTSASFTAIAGSDLDSGWTGIGHNGDVTVGSTITFRVLRRCTDSQEPCETDADCTNQECEPTCNCQDDTSCEAFGPTHPTRCVTTLTLCDTNADCPPVVECARMFGPPLPLSADGNPTCVVSRFASPITGTADSSTGHAVVTSDLKSRVYLGELNDRPCPQCGAADQDPQIGDEFTCTGGQTPGAACTVNALSPDFGGVSFDCAPETGGNISGDGLAIRITKVSTRTVSKQANLPCANFLFENHPSLGFAFCIDNVGNCESNADCLRCQGDITTVCASNGDCGGDGPCAAAPDQPISCGRQCHCGFCDNDPDLPCFDTSDCPEGAVCEAGDGSLGANAGQNQPNECSATGEFICGVSDTEKCPNTISGKCSEKDYVGCAFPGDPVCPNNNAGECVLDFKPCFEDVITRTGTPSPLGKHCANDPDTRDCETNADCAGDDVCVENSSRPTSAGLFCIPATSSSTINSAAGLTGPGAIKFEVFVKMCSCGDGEIGCDEQCDDSNTANNDGCNEICQIE